MELKVRAVRADGAAEQVTLCFESCVLNWSELLELARADAPCAGPVAFCSGTVPVEDGNIRYADAWDIRLEDPVMGRAIEHRYEVIRLEDRN